MNCLKYGILVAILMHAISIYFVINGFFATINLKNANNANLGTSDSVCNKIHSRIPLKNFVLVVIDAFRHDFFFNSTFMPKIKSLIEKGDAVAFIAKAHSPTVTMPRIKSILSGWKPSFSDLFMNFASSKFSDDNWLSIAKENSKRIVFYGDETWFSLFTKSFFEERSEKVNSLYVVDYTEVDNNVTRHLTKEFEPKGIKNWDIMILHYLGLDHIGHSLGSKSPQIGIKLNEMDQIIFNITESLSRHNEFTIVVLGDHGMTLDGNHGGNSNDETSVPLIVIKKKISNGLKNYDSVQLKKLKQKRLSNAENFVKPIDVIKQIDIVPTVTFLLDLPKIPVNNIGVSFFSQIETNLSLIASKIQLNAQQFVNLLNKITFIPKVEKNELLDNLNKCLDSKQLSSICSINNKKDYNFNTSKIFKQCEIAMKNVQNTIFDYLKILNKNENLLYGIFFCLIGLILLLLNTTTLNFNIMKMNELQLILMLEPLLYFSSSLIEEEHDVWYFLLPLFLTYKLYLNLRAFFESNTNNYYQNKVLYYQHFIYQERWLLGTLICHRFAHYAVENKRRRWIMFGNEKIFNLFKQNNFIDINVILSWLTYYKINSLFNIIEILCAIIIVFHNLNFKFFLLPCKIGFIGIFIYKFFPIFSLSYFINKIIYFSIFWSFVTKNYYIGLQLWLLFLIKTNYLHILILSWSVGYAIGKIEFNNKIKEACILYTAMNSAFFYIGNTNGVSSIDIIPGYTGLSFYFPTLVAIQILLNSYSCPISVFLGWQYFKRSNFKDFKSINKNTPSFPFQKILIIFLIFRSTALLGSMCSAFNFQFHIMIWTVFMPKILIEIVHFLLNLLLIFLVTYLG